MSYIIKIYESFLFLQQHKNRKKIPCEIRKYMSLFYFFNNIRTEKKISCEIRKHMTFFSS